MSASPIEVVTQWLQNLANPDVVNEIVAQDATFDSLNTRNVSMTLKHLLS
jgi:hypothetical protein